MTKIVIASCAQYPVLSASNKAYADALADQGADVDVLPWNQAPLSQFCNSDLIVLRQTWDYQNDPGGYAAWASRLRTLSARVENPPELAIWNNDKRTIRELSATGVQIPRTCHIEDQAPEEIFSSIGTDKVVLKPAFGGSGVGVTLCERDTFAERLREARNDAPGRPFIAQEFLPEIANGEWKLTYIDRELAVSYHAVPSPGEFRINTRFRPIADVKSPPPEADTAARNVLSWISHPLLYCRIDGVMRGDTFVCTELELTDPDLHLHLVPGAAQKMAIATLERIPG